MGVLYYANPSGQVSGYGDSLRTNGIILGTDAKTFYVTNITIPFR
jgi:sugar lactone lactonase YvrE